MPTVRIRRRVGGAAGGPATVLAVGEPAYNDEGDTLHISNGTANRLVVGADRQLELTGQQAVVAGTANAKTYDLTSAANANIRILGGAQGNVLSRGANPGDVEWAATAPFTGIQSSGAFTGDGTSAAELELVCATNTEVRDGVSTPVAKAICSAGLQTVTGDLDDLDTGAQATLVDAINETLERIVAMTGAIILVGTFNATTGQIDPGFNSPAGPTGTPVAIPVAGSANQGWYAIVSTAGAGGSANVPATPGGYAVGDWVLSSGTAWLHFQMNLGVINAGNVTINSFTYDSTTITVTNVQDAIEELYSGTTLAGMVAVETDGTSILGDGLAATPLYVNVIDGGTF
jgi:hypothetical protein